MSAAVCSTLALVAAAHTACVGTQCDYGVDTFSGTGELVGPDTWESSPMTGVPWPALNPGHALVLKPTPLLRRGYFTITPYISPDPSPNRPGFLCGSSAPPPDNQYSCSNFTVGAGSLAEVTIVGDDIWIANASCAQYYVRVVVTAYPAPPDAGFLDAGPPGPPIDATTGDATSTSDGAASPNDAGADGP